MGLPPLSGRNGPDAARFGHRSQFGLAAACTRPRRPQGRSESISGGLRWPGL